LFSVWCLIGQMNTLTVRVVFALAIVIGLARGAAAQGGPGGDDGRTSPRRR